MNAKWNGKKIGKKKRIKQMIIARERKRGTHKKIYVTIVKPAIYGPSAMVISE